MGYLLDTHLLLWSFYKPHLLPRQFVSIVEPATTIAYFSVVSMIEIAIKQNTGKLQFSVSLTELRQELLRNRYVELQVKSAHAFALGELPQVHKDPFDRLLVAQAIAEKLVLLTVDDRLARYGYAVQLLR